MTATDSVPTAGAETVAGAAVGGSQDTGAAPGYVPRRTLKLRVELIRQLKRRRTQWTFGLMFALPVVLLIALQVGVDGGDGGGQTDSRISLVDVATASGLNFTLFVLFATTGFFLVVVFALFFGDSIASEAQWGSLRYALASPIPRARLLRQKYAAALVLSLAALALLVVTAVIAGGLFFGWGAAQTPIGLSLAPGDAYPRMLAIVGYLALTQVTVGSFAFWLSCRTDAPLAAVGGAVFTIIVCGILDSIDQLGFLRDYLPTNEQYAWTGMLQSPVDSAHMLQGAILAVAYSSLFTGLAFRHFLRKDVVS
ncbi:MAG: ABC transporter permease subunit [Geodermatophilaceae bacterium]|nr:ABC transporter permease subunit [Geodermatophilaceae bacterium]